MTFLAPLFLLGALAIAGPIIVHLIRRTTRERVAFSSLMFLRPSPPRPSRRHRFEHLLLLLLRCAALTLLALAFARPFFASKPPAAGGGFAKRVVVLVDVSASMRRDGLWDDARKAVDAQIRTAGPADQLALFTYDTGVRPLLSFAEWNRLPVTDRAAAMSSRLATVSPGWGATHLGHALIGAAEALLDGDPKTATGPRQIVLVSDLQAGSRLDGLQGYDWPKGVELLLRPVVARHATNAGLQLIADNRAGADATQRAVRVRVTNAATARREQFRLQVAGAENATSAAGAGEVAAYVPPGQSRAFTVAWPNAGTFDRVVLAGDDEPFDNVAYVVAPTQQTATVLWLGRENPRDARDPALFLRRAFAPTPRLAVNVVAQDPNAATPRAVEAADLVFVAEPISPEVATALHAAVQRGKTVVLATSSPEIASTLATLVGRASLPVTEATVASYAMFAEIDFRHRLFAPFADPRFSDFTKIHVWHYRRIDTNGLADAHVLARFDSGDPAVLEIPTGNGRVVVLATTWSPSDSQLAVSSKFVPLMWSLLEFGGTAVAAVEQVYVGDAMTVPGADFNAVRRPDGTTVPLPPGAKSFADTNVPGIYEFVGATKRLRFAVNLDPNEVRTAPLALEDLERLGVPAKSAAQHADATAKAVQLQTGLAAENRQKLWRWAIAAAVIVLLIETALAGRAARRDGRAEEVTA